MTWNTGSTVFAVAPRSATARRNAPDTVVALTPGSASGRTHCIASSLMRCAISMQRSSSSVLVSFAGPSTTLASHTGRPASAVHSGNGASSSAIGPSVSAATSSWAPSAVSTASHSSIIGPGRAPWGNCVKSAGRGSSARSTATERQADARGASAAGGRAPVRYETLFCPQQTSVATPAASIAARTLATRAPIMRSKSTRAERCVSASRGLTSSRGRGPGSTSSTVV